MQTGKEYDLNSKEIILKEIIIEDELYTQKELDESISNLQELKELFETLGFTLNLSQDKINIIETQTQKSNNNIINATQVLVELPKEFYQRRSKEIKYLLLLSGITLGFSIGGPLGLLLTTKASVGLAGAGIGAITGGCMGITLSEYINLPFWKKKT